MTGHRTNPLSAGLALGGLIALAAVEPAFAQSSGVGGNIGTFIQNIIDLLNSNVIRGLAVIAVIITGIAWMLGHPHVHVAVCARGVMGERLNPKKADLEHWRQTFAQALRDRGVAAEATPRRARGVTRKAERAPVRKLRERHEAGRTGAPKVSGRPIMKRRERRSWAMLRDGLGKPARWSARLLFAKPISLRLGYWRDRRGRKIVGLPSGSRNSCVACRRLTVSASRWLGRVLNLVAGEAEA